MSTGLLSHGACAAHEMGSWHPECPSRLASIQDRLIITGLAQHLEYIDAPEAPIAALLRAHDPAYVEMLQRSIPEEGYYSLDPDTLVCSHSWQAARRAVGAVLEATDRVLDGSLDNAFCAVRPPGHHAGSGMAMGFCLLNNVAIGVLHALEVHGLERVAVIDFDVHHGNGTEEILAAIDRGGERVLMTSFFQHPFYPYSGVDNPKENMVNVPLPAGSDGARVRAVVDEIWIPRLEKFRPQMIFISAGFDAHREDDIGQMSLVEADYAYITRRVMEVAQRYSAGRIVSSLEGGYNLSALGRSAETHVRALAQL
ncbi:MAG TPA: histone deacetylase family protein [Burkholderiaceae bacterium]|nr:histone deacetylase family protein [Burkholderiaceae bacterium]